MIQPTDTDSKTVGCQVSGTHSNPHDPQIAPEDDSLPSMPAREPASGTPNLTAAEAGTAGTPGNLVEGAAWDFRSEYPLPEPTSEFERKYPSDHFGDEVTDNARVWKIYRDEASAESKVMLNGWNKTLDILLLFAALFSAVSTTFIIESYKLLQPDYTEVIAKTLLAALSTQGGLVGLNVSAVHAEASAASLLSFLPSSSARWVNGLWFVSLGLSLAVALLCILAKQWLEEYHLRIYAPSSSPRHWTRRHVRYKQGLTQWRVAAVISVLPAALHASLFLFLGGLFVFLRVLDAAIAASLLCVAAPLLTFYVASICIPLFRPDCPWSTSFVRHIGGLPQLLGIRRLLSHLSVLGPSVGTEPGRLARHANERVLRAPSQRLPASESRPASKEPLSDLEGKALEWLITSSESSDIVSVAVQSIGSLPPLGGTVTHLNRSEARRAVIDFVDSARPLEVPGPSGSIALARLRRVYLSLAAEVRVGPRAWWSESFERLYDLPLLVPIGFTQWGQVDSCSAPRTTSSDVTQTSLRSAFLDELMTCIRSTTRRDDAGLGSASPFHPSTSALLLLHIPSFAFLIHVFHLNRVIWLQDPASIRLVVQCARRSLALHNIDPSRTGTDACEGCAFTQLELWCQILALAPDLVLDAHDVAILTENIRWLARLKEWDGYTCPFGATHTFAHFAYALDMCASTITPVRDLPASILGLGLRVHAGPGPQDGLPEVWSPAAARTVIHSLQSLWLTHCDSRKEKDNNDELEDRFQYLSVCDMLDGLCHSGSIHKNRQKHHPRCAWAVTLPYPCRWDYSAAWDNPTCFLLEWENRPSVWDILWARRDAQAILLAGDVLTAQLCFMHRSGEDVSELASRLFVYSTCLPFLHIMLGLACRTASIELGAANRSSAYNGDELLAADRPRIVRFMQHSIELRGWDWWDAGASIIRDKEDETLISWVAGQNTKDTMISLEGIATAVPRFRAYVVGLDIELRHRGTCTQCSAPIRTGLATRPGTQDVERQCLGWTCFC